MSSAARNAAAAQGGDWAAGGSKYHGNFDRVVIMAIDKLSNSTGFAFVGGETAWVGNGSNTRITGGVALHEWGHNWGVYHANYWVGDNGIPRNASGTHDGGPPR